MDSNINNCLGTLFGLPHLSPCGRSEFRDNNVVKHDEKNKAIFAEVSGGAEVVVSVTETNKH